MARLISFLLASLLAALLVWFVGGPVWAIVSVAYLSGQINDNYFQLKLLRAAG